MADDNTVDISEIMVKQMNDRLAREKDIINEPEHYKGETLELQDVFKDFFGIKNFILICTANIIKYAFRLNKKDTVLQNAKKIKKYASMIIEAEENNK